MFRTGAHTETICVCTDGYTGDPDNLDLGCAAHISNSPIDNAHEIGKTTSTIHRHDGCQVKNETYAIGAQWFDGCEYRCICDDKKETLCQVCINILINREVHLNIQITLQANTIYALSNIYSLDVKSYQKK